MASAHRALCRIAILRWQRANGEWVPPPVIVDIIEEYGWRAQFHQLAGALPPFTMRLNWMRPASLSVCRST